MIFEKMDVKSRILIPMVLISILTLVHSNLSLSQTETNPSLATKALANKAKVADYLNKHGVANLKKYAAGICKQSHQMIRKNDQTGDDNWSPLMKISHDCASRYPGPRNFLNYARVSAYFVKQVSNPAPDRPAYQQNTVIKTFKLLEIALQVNDTQRELNATEIAYSKSELKCLQTYLAKGTKHGDCEILTAIFR